MIGFFILHSWTISPHYILGHSHWPTKYLVPIAINNILFALCFLPTLSTSALHPLSYLYLHICQLFNIHSLYILMATPPLHLPVPLSHTLPVPFPPFLWEWEASVGPSLPWHSCSRISASSPSEARQGSWALGRGSKTGNRVSFPLQSLGDRLEK